MSVFGKMTEEETRNMMRQVLRGSVSMSKSEDGATTTLRIITPHVECPSQQEVYELALPQALLNELLECPAGSWGDIERVSVKHMPDGDDDAPPNTEEEKEKDDNERNDRKRKRL